jgi:hypothetical protein
MSKKRLTDSDLLKEAQISYDQLSKSWDSYYKKLIAKEVDTSMLAYTIDNLIAAASRLIFQENKMFEQEEARIAAKKV